MTTVSVIVTCHNIEQFIGECVESIINQTFKDLELILVNDGSGDLTGSICEQLAHSYSNISVIHQSNQGVSAARRHGLQQAHGNWIMFVDGDDTLPKQAIEKMVNICLMTNVDLFVGGSSLHTDKGLIPIPIKLERYGVYSKDEYVKLVADYKVPMSLCFRLFSRELLSRIDICIPRDITNNEDYLYNLFISPYIKTAYISKELVYNYNQRELCKARKGRATNRQCNWDYWEKYFLFLYENYKKYQVPDDSYLHSVLLKLSSLIIGSHDYKRLDLNIRPFDPIKNVRPSRDYNIKQNLVIFIYRYRNLSVLLIPLMRIHPKKILEFFHLRKRI